MAVPVPSRRRSTRETGARVALAVIAAALGYAAVRQSLPMVVQARAPGVAHALAPDNGYITGRLAAALSGPTATAADRARADQLARLALRQDPAALDAAVTLGLDAQIRGDPSVARRAFTYAEALSRRSLQTQLWAIGDGIARNDTAGVLHHYDIALRTSDSAQALLFPTLAKAIAEPSVRAALVSTLAGQPAWSEGFVASALGNSADPVALAALLTALSKRGVLVADGASAGVVNTLLTADKPDEAWAYYTAIRPGADRRVSRDPGFRNASEAPSAFDWVPVNDGSIAAAIQPNGNGGGVLTFAAPPSIGGIAAQQVELLRPGTYQIEGQSEGIDQTEDALPYWSLSCRGGRELGRVDVPNSSVIGGRFTGRFTVPADCPVQLLALTLRPSSEVSGISGQIDHAALRPIG